MLAIVSAMAGTILCNAPGVRREASLTILFTTHKMDAVYTAAEHSEQSNAENLGYF